MLIELTILNSCPLHRVIMIKRLRPQLRLEAAHDADAGRADQAERVAVAIGGVELFVEAFLCDIRLHLVFHFAHIILHLINVQAPFGIIKFAALDGDKVVLDVDADFIQINAIVTCIVHGNCW